ncbi:MAG: hypothetical protein EBS05_25120 [Proteobacteria bacterium]|nr:hypothetical protein [Pseudomonadota bacterium]
MRLQKLGTDADLVAFPELAYAVEAVGARITNAEALDNLRILEQTQRLLRTNVQEALEVEVGLIKLPTGFHRWSEVFVPQSIKSAHASELPAVLERRVSLLP